MFARDLYEAWTGLMAAGDLQTARDATLFLFERQQHADGSMPRNSLVNGKTAPDSFGTQLDEVAYPILMAASTRPHRRDAVRTAHQTGRQLRGRSWSVVRLRAVGRAVRFLAVDDRRRDRRVDGRRRHRRHQRRRASAAVWRGVADDFQRSIKGWTVTTNGPQSTDPYFIRLSKTGDPNAAIAYNVGNGGPTLDQRDGDRRRLPRALPARRVRRRDPDFAQLAAVVDATIKSDTDSGPGWHRYNGDGYGDGAGDGHPWAPSDKGTGHLWPALTAERGEQSMQTGDAAGAAALLDAMARFSSGVGLIPEQAWELPDLAASPFGTDPTVASIGFTQRQAGRFGITADVVGRLVRAAVRRPRAPDKLRRPARRTRSSATSPTTRVRRRSASPPRPTARRSPARR